MPEPTNINNHELSSNFDSELDLTVLENKENEILDDCNMEDYEFVSVQESNQNLASKEIQTSNQSKQTQIERASNPTPTSRVATIATNSMDAVTIETTSNAQKQQQQSIPLNNTNSRKNPNQENALNKLLQKIRQQREDSNVKNVNKELDASNGNTPVTTPKMTSRTFLLLLLAP